MSSTEKSHGSLNKRALHSLFEGLDRAITQPARICLIGATATIAQGNDARETGDIDIWAPASEINLGEFSDALEKFGVALNPPDEDPLGVYVQVIHPGIVQVPGWDPKRRTWFGEPETAVWTGGKLTITVPPAPAIIASKMMRGNTRDLEDCIWLLAAKAVEAENLNRALRCLPKLARENATENLEIVKLVSGMKKPGMGF